MKHTAFEHRVGSLQLVLATACVGDGVGLSSPYYWALGMGAGKDGADVKDRTMLLPCVQETHWMC